MRRLLLLAMVATGPGCVEDPYLKEASISVRVELTTTGIELTQLPLAPGVHDPADGPRILLEQRDASGRVIASGWRSDPRSPWVEAYDASGQPRRVASAGTGWLRTNLLAIPGTLAVFEETPDGNRLLGEAGVDPSVLPSAAGLTAGEYEEPVPIGPSRGDHRLLFLPEGYRYDQLQSYRALVDQLVEHLASRSDWARYAARFDFVIQEPRPPQPGRRPPDPTPFHCSCRDGLLQCDGLRLADELRAQAGARATVIVVNPSQQCMSSGGPTVLYSATDPKPGILAHELAHSILGLGDEYPEQTAYRCGGQQHRTYPNVTDNPNWPPWREQIAPGTPLPTPDSAGRNVVGAFRGALYCDHLYRPQLTCMMRFLDDPACAVCRGVMDAYFGAPRRQDPGLLQPAEPFVEPQREPEPPPEQQGARDCRGYDWQTLCLPNDGCCDQGDGCCTDDPDNARGTCDCLGPAPGGQTSWDGAEQSCMICGTSVRAYELGPCACEGRLRVVWLVDAQEIATQECSQGVWETFAFDPPDVDACCTGDYRGC